MIAHDERPDPELAALLADVGATIDDELCHTPVPWDFAAMLARAHTLDPAAVDAQQVAEAQLAAPVTSLAQERRRRITRNDAAFDKLIADVRADAEHDAALRMHGVEASPRAAAPRMHVVREAGSKRAAPRPWVSLVWGASALAAVLVLAFGLREGVRYVQRDRDAQRDEALHLGEHDDAPERQARERDEVPQRRTGSDGPREPAPLEGSTAPTEVMPATPEAAPGDVVRVGRSSGKPRSKASAPLPSLAERIAAIDAEAHAAWKARDLARAEERFEALIELAGGSHLTELAYGDLFTLARRRGDTTRELALWKRYLSRFPDGRFADDARAGLCRRAEADARASCWRTYLDDFPQGSFRAQAERETEGGG